MKNQEQPINPVPNNSGYLIGLTKREYIATKMMQAMLSNIRSATWIRISELNGMIGSSIGIADELLKQLEKQP